MIFKPNTANTSITKSAKHARFSQRTWVSVPRNSP
jgi:hypothetical protein